MVESSADANLTVSKELTDARFAREKLSRGVIVVILEAGFLLAIAILALFGNSLICVAMYRNRMLRRKLTNIFILSLAISDILMACFCMPLSAGVLIRGKWVYSDFACDFQAYWIYVLAGISLYTMAVTAVNRFYRVVKPRTYSRYFSTRSTFLMVFLVWFLIAFTVGLLVKMTWLRVKFQSAKASCVLYAWLGSKGVTFIYQILAFLVFFVVPTVLISRCYRKVFKKVRQHQSDVAGNLRRQTLRRVSRRRGGLVHSLTQQNIEEIDITRTLFRVVVAFALCWTPIIIYEIVVISSNIFHFHDSLPRQVHLIWLYFGSVGSAVNAFIYGGMNRAFRREFVKIFKCRRNSRVLPNGLTTETLANTVQS